MNVSECMYLVNFVNSYTHVLCIEEQGTINGHQIVVSVNPIVYVSNVTICQ